MKVSKSQHRRLPDQLLLVDENVASVGSLGTPVPTVHRKMVAQKQRRKMWEVYLCHHPHLSLPRCQNLLLQLPMAGSVGFADNQDTPVVPAHSRCSCKMWSVHLQCLNLVPRRS
mmetsp:Transcript_28829/g.45449  ORF Transcript_28829/g.45449 Transcript_28829/m.45449 type:complete len:114 (+) Transcript_28829:207-548(+)